MSSQEECTSNANRSNRWVKGKKEDLSENNMEDTVMLEVATEQELGVSTM